MSTPRHRTTEGASYFVTTKCAQGHRIFQMPEYAEILIETLHHYRERSAYLLHEFVVMPDHLHLIFTLGPTTSLEKAMQLVKGGSSFRINRLRERKLQVWQQGFHDWTIRDETDWCAKAEYIAMNPVRARLVGNFRDWPYSSASGRFVLDPMPARFSNLPSGAKAPVVDASARGLKPPPPKETQAQMRARSLSPRKEAR
jgi:putative transposase